MEGKRRELDGLIARHAIRERGNVARRQLLAGGAAPWMIDRRVRERLLTPQFRGVYFAGPGPQPPLAREYAAILACAPQALLGGRTAGHLLKLGIALPRDIEVIVIGRQLRGRAGLRVSTIGSLEEPDVRRIAGIPVSSPALTILDLAGALDEGEFASALNEARVKSLVTDRELHATLAGHPKRRGVRALRRLLASENAVLATESEAEALCLAVMREHGVEPTATQAQIGPYRVDFLFEAERLIVEVDGHRYHGTRHRFTRDRRRLAYLTAHGYAVFPLTWSDLVDRSAAAMQELKAALAARRVEVKPSDHDTDPRASGECRKHERARTR